ncbi:PREDICTED: 39S ribosomal protein L37, mitochondrial [Elephantulus edwardii]|uniref:39S ribosomal protein L37, mitochondrial n=1 Tax=Elephantulus edwardii TaxID=28737 RepID=UPI0003F0885B|nr:PREDICTED: 39S ribosomal protein L37, mitochondrial [Elephantulus edwardii]
MHFVPGLARPVFSPWDRGWFHPKFHRSPPIQEQPLYKDQACYIFHQRCRLLEGMKQALWLTKTKLIEGLPEKVLSLVDDPDNHIENQDERVLNAISHARLWHSTEDIPKRETYCPIIVESLMQLCRSQILKHPALTQRICAKNYSFSTSWNRESILLQVRGSSGTRVSTKDPLPAVAAREKVEATKNHVLETFYPISPTIDLQECNVYHMKNNTGFREDHPYPYPHTLYFLETANLRPHRFRPEQLRAKMVLFAFGSALAQAQCLYGDDPKVLEQPVTVQSVGTDGRLFQFLVFQLNTTDLASDAGVKNLVWVDSDQLLYEHFWCRPVIKKKVMVEPVGPVGYQPETFKKFLALYLHGAV